MPCLDLLESATRSSSNTTVDSNQLDTIARFALVDQVVIENNVGTARKLARGCTLGHFLNTDALMVPEVAKTELGFERILAFVELRCKGCRGRLVGDRACGVAIFLG